ncbi:MAG: hypothetical protein QF412_01175 [Planctomycetota bacterium]|nr:hypothetical protein [Planctomycetota bacterium]
MRLIFPATLILAIGAADLAAQIPMCDFTRTYTANRVRGYYFQCPSDFVVTHLQVPDESA